MEIKTEQLKVSDLKPADYNPRQMPLEEMEKLKHSIAEFGFVEPVVVNSYPGRENIIVGGHQRVEAARQLGIESVPVIFVNLELKREQLLNLALNKIQGKWDDDKLAEIFETFDLSSADTLLSGFDSSEIDTLLENFRDNKKEEFDVDKVVEQIGTPESKPGEVYELGPHRLMCGDSSNSENVDKLLAGVQIDLVFTDPPYNVAYKSRGKNRSKWHDAYGDDDYKEEDFEDFCFRVFSNFKRYLKAGGAYYICSGWSSWSAFWRALCRIQLKPRGCIIWDKGHGGMGWSDYWYQHELIGTGFNFEFKEDSDEVYEMITYGFSDQVKHYFAKRGGSRTSDVWRVARDPVHCYSHPTQKPIKLIENAISNSSKIGDKVLDLFGGSGSTLVAADKTGRVAFLMERSPLFCDVIRKRYEELTRKD